MLALQSGRTNGTAHNDYFIVLIKLPVNNAYATVLSKLRLMRAMLTYSVEQAKVIAHNAHFTVLNKL